ncbi:MAG: META domain-containing protein [Candidatus Promineifilaceae bacterium]
MQKPKSFSIWALLIVSLTILLTACGGEDPEPTPQPALEPTRTPLAETTSVTDETEPAPTMTSEEELIEAEATVGEEDVGTQTPQASEMTAVIVSGDSTGTGKPFSFDATQSQINGFTIEGYVWDMGDGTFLHGLSVEHAYSEPGLYTVTLTITAVGGETHTTSKVVEVVDLLEGVTPTAVSESTLSGTSWKMNNAMRGTTITLVFAEETLAGSSGCNSYDASYVITAADGSTANISVSSISTSSETCTPEVMAQEGGFLESLASARSYTIREATLTLETGSGTLTFSQVEAVG